MAARAETLHLQYQVLTLRYQLYSLVGQPYKGMVQNFSKGLLGSMLLAGPWSFNTLCVFLYSSSIYERKHDKEPSALSVCIFLFSHIHLKLLCGVSDINQTSVFHSVFMRMVSLNLTCVYISCTDLVMNDIFFPEETSSKVLFL